MNRHPINQTLPGPRWGGLLIFCFVFLVASHGTSAQLSLNVTNFGAKGDAVQFYVNTVSNSVVVTTTNRFSAADIGKTIELFTVGQRRVGINSYGVNATNYVDLIATITNVVDGTNLYVTSPPMATRTNAFATCGTDNVAAFSNVLVACTGYSNAVINIPNGVYLLMPFTRTRMPWEYGTVAVIINRAGLRFVGESRTGTVLLGRGAFASDNYPTEASYRGILFELVAPVTGDLSFENMTWDGGVNNGLVDNQVFPANEVDGNGWDWTHGAYLTYDAGNNKGTAAHTCFSNLVVQHWRGEMLKTIDGNINGLIAIKDCLFLDGNATALNIYGGWDVTGNTFSNLFQIGEYYQRYSIGTTNVSYFRNNYSTNIWGNGFAINGAHWDAPPFIMQSNLFYFNGAGQNGILTMPGANIQIIDNELRCANHMAAFAIGAAGSQTYNGMYNSNILIAGNSIYAPAVLGSVFAFGGDMGECRVKQLTICSNYVEAPESIIYGITAVGPGAYDVIFHHNTIVSPSATTTTGASGEGYAPFLLFQTNNSYRVNPKYYLADVQTNVISYSTGPKTWLDYVKSGNVFVLNDSEAARLPAGAWLEIDNRTNRWTLYGSGDLSGNVIVYPSQTMTTSLVLSNGMMATFYWTGTAWTTNSPVKSMFSLTVNSGTGSGTYASGTAVAVTATPISGKKFTYWSGVTNVMVNPFATNTTLIMPAGNAAITANYTNKMTPPANLRPAVTNTP